MLIVGGEDHKSGTEDDGEARIQRLEEWARARYPQMGPVTYAWSGQVQEPADYVGFIGLSPEHERVWLATGDSGQGITTGGVAALILSDLLNGRESPWAGLYDPHRKMHRSLGEYVKENVEAAKHWVELATAHEIQSADEIAPGHGGLMKHDGKPVAVYRDEGGELHARSAVCTHAGCVVHWNSYERCWDCPCHGSQFSPDGDVLCGPAASPLKAVQLDEDERTAHDERDERPRPSPRSGTYQGETFDPSRAGLGPGYPLPCQAAVNSSDDPLHRLEHLVRPQRTHLRAPPSAYARTHACASLRPSARESCGAVETLETWRDA
jgi:nitrite reductase/ring-hydroxylating ferredoxin subunit